MFKKENGVTLVALVITIIVLLILAGVSIALVSGDNGVLTKAQRASTKTKYSQVTEAIDLALADCQAEFADDFAEGKSSAIGNYFTEKAISEALAKQGYKLAKIKSGGTGYEDVTSTTDTEAAYNKAVSTTADTYLVHEDKATTGVTVTFTSKSMAYIASCKPGIVTVATGVLVEGSDK